jgi:hypothetical protein
MITFFKQRLFACIIFLTVWMAGNAQTSVNFKTGVETWALKDECDDLGKSKHPGQFFGFDVFVEKNRKIFVPGFHYHRISIYNEEENFDYNFSESHHVHYFTIPMTFGYRFLDQPIWKISAFGGPEVNFFYDLDSNDVGLDDDQFYGVWSSLTAVLHTEISSLVTAEVKYHYALQPIIKIRDESKFRGWTLAVGVTF